MIYYRKVIFFCSSGNVATWYHLLINWVKLSLIINTRFKCMSQLNEHLKVLLVWFHKGLISDLLQFSFMYLFNIIRWHNMFISLADSQQEHNTKMRVSRSASQWESLPSREDWCLLLRLLFLIVNYCRSFSQNIRGVMLCFLTTFFSFSKFG